MSPTTTTEELIRWRKDLADILYATGSLVLNSWKPPIIDASAPDADDMELAILSGITGMKAFQSLVMKEIEALDKYLNNPRPTHPISTNALYFVSVWKEVIQASSLVAIGRTFNTQVAPIGRPGPKSAANDVKPAVKVDVVADEGRSWIRINTIKNSRMQAELNEIDAYAHEDFESDSDGEPSSPSNPTHPLQQPLENSVVQMGRALVEAAKCNPLPGTSVLPQVTMRLLRLTPDPLDAPSSISTGKNPSDPRIRQTIEELQKMGITVLLGEREDTRPPVMTEPPCEEETIPPATTTPEEYRPTPPLRVTQQLNLDLSLLVAIVSDLAHSPVPADEEESITRYRLLDRPWKKKESTEDGDSGDNPHSRALSNQANQERNIGLLKEIHTRLNTSLPFSTSSPQQPGPIEETGYQFWTTSEAKIRLSGIISKIGGPNEKRRANALFLTCKEEAEEQFWRGSRFPLAYVKGLVPVMVYPSPEPDPKDDRFVSPFHGHLAQTCRSVVADLVSQSSSQSPTSSSSATPSHVPIKAMLRARGDEKHGSSSKSRNAIPLHPNSLTFHTVRALLWGASNGMTTITANKASIKAILREMKKHPGRLTRQPAEEGPKLQETIDSLDLSDGTRAAVWIVEPRSLGESMRADRTTTET